MNCTVHLQVYRPTPQSTRTKHGRSVYPCEAQHASGSPECNSPDTSSRTKLGQPLVAQTRCDLNERPFPKPPPGTPTPAPFPKPPPGACSGKESAGRPSATARRWPFPPDDCRPDTLLKRRPRFTCVYLKKPIYFEKDKTPNTLPARPTARAGRLRPPSPREEERMLPARQPIRAEPLALPRSGANPGGEPCVAEVGPGRVRGAMAAGSAAVLARALEALGEGRGVGEGTTPRCGDGGELGGSWASPAPAGWGVEGSGAGRPRPPEPPHPGAGVSPSRWDREKACGGPAGVFPAVRGPPGGFAGGRRPGYSSVALGRAAVLCCRCRRACPASR